MGDAARTLGNYAKPTLAGTGSSIVPPPVDNRNFEVKTPYVQMVQQRPYSSNDHECPSQHLRNFTEIVELMKFNGVHADVVPMRLFSFSLQGKAKAWLDNQPINSFRTWDALARAFLEEFFPPYKTDAIRGQISNFQQRYGELYHETWDRFQALLYSCPHHNMEEWTLADIFARALDYENTRMINQATDGDLKLLTPTRSLQLFREMAVKTKSWARRQAPRNLQAPVAPPSSSTPKQALEDNSDQSLHLLHSKVDALVHQMNNMALSKAPVKEVAPPPKPQPRKAVMVYYCEGCGHEGHDVSTCQLFAEEAAPEEEMENFEQVDYVQGGQQQVGYNQGGYQNNFRSNQGGYYNYPRNNQGYRNYQQGLGPQGQVSNPPHTAPQGQRPPRQ